MILSSDFLSSIDFTQFSLNHFSQAVADLHGRSIRFYDRPMPLTLQGLWLNDPTHSKDYIFINTQCPHLLQDYTAVYNLVHILLGHSTFSLTMESLTALVEGDAFESSVLQAISTYAVGETERFKDEAEFIALEICTRWLADRLNLSFIEKQCAIANLLVLLREMSQVVLTEKTHWVIPEEPDKAIYFLLIKILEQSLTTLHLDKTRMGHKLLGEELQNVIGCDADYEDTVRYYNEIGKRIAKSTRPA